MAERGNRDEIVLATKVGGGRGAVRSLRAENIAHEAPPRSSACRPTASTSTTRTSTTRRRRCEETLRAFDALVRAGTVRHLGASNYTPERLTAALELQREHGLAEFTVLQPHYNLVERDFERTLLPVAEAWDLAVLPVLRAGEGLPDRQVPPRRRRRRVRRAPRAPAPTSTPAARRCSRRSTRSPRPTTSPVAAVALAWLRAQPQVVAPIASARTDGAARATSCRRRRSS